MDEQTLEQVSAAVRKEVDAGVTSIKATTQENASAIAKMTEELSSMREKVIALEKSKMAVSVPGCNDGNDKGRFKFARMLKGIGTGDWKGCDFEREVLNAAQEKALSQGTPSAGGYVVPVEYMPELIDMLRANTVLDKLGVTRINPMSSPVEIPRQSGGATAYWVAENAAITGSQQAFEQVTMSPKAVASLVKASRRLVMLADPSIEEIVRRDIAQSLALALDIKALVGDGTSNTPIGVTEQPNISTLAVGADGDEFTYNFALDLIGKLEDENALAGSLGFVSNPAVFRKLKKQAVAQYSGDTSGSPLFAPILSDANLAANLGYNVATTTALPKNGTKGSGTALSQVIFGNWQDLILAQWGSMMIEASTVAGDNNGGAFTSHQMWFKAVMEVDVAVRHPKSFAVATYVKTT